MVKIYVIHQLKYLFYKLSSNNNAIHVPRIYQVSSITVESLLFVVYHFSWISCIQVNHKFKHSTKSMVLIGFVSRYWQNLEIIYPWICKFHTNHKKWYPWKSKSTFFTCKDQLHYKVEGTISRIVYFSF